MIPVMLRLRPAPRAHPGPAVRLAILAHTCDILPASDVLNPGCSPEADVPLAAREFMLLRTAFFAPVRYIVDDPAGTLPGRAPLPGCGHPPLPKFDGGRGCAAGLAWTSGPAARLGSSRSDGVSCRGSARASWKRRKRSCTRRRRLWSGRGKRATRRPGSSRPPVYI